MKKSKPGYSIYSPNTLRFKKLMVKSGRKELKKASIPEVANEIFNSPIANNLDKHLLVAEVLFEHDGRNVLFPGNADFYSKLLKSNFSLDDSATLNLPYSSFILAMPKSFEVEGIKIPSIVVNYNKAGERKERYDLASKLMKLPQMAHQENNLLGSDSLSFFYQDPYEEDGVIVQVNQTPAQIAGALKANTPEEYASILGKIPKDLVSPVAMEPSHEDKIIQWVVTKLIAGISVYLSAMDDSKLVSGLPNNGRIAISNMKTDIKYNFSYLPLQSTVSNESGEDMIRIRNFYFRQLRAPIYYRNEYKDLKPGSRWVFVREAQIGKYNAAHIE